MTLYTKWSLLSRVCAQESSSIEDQFGNLPSLHTGAIRAVWGALELKRHFPTLHLCHSFLSKVAQFIPIKNHAGSVEGIGLDLNRILEPHWEGVTGSIREVFAEVLSQQHSLAFQLDLSTVLCWATTRSIQAEASDENSFIHCKLYTVAAPPVTPLIASVGAGLESVATLRCQTLPGLADELQLRLLGCCVPKEYIIGLIKCQHPRLGCSIGKVIQSHCRDTYQVHGFSQNLPLVVSGRGELLSLALSLSPTECCLKYHYLFSIECLSL